MGHFIYLQTNFYIVWHIYFLIFVTGQHQILCFCIKPNESMENESKKKIIEFNM